MSQFRDLLLTLWDTVKLLQLYSLNNVHGGAAAQQLTLLVGMPVSHARMLSQVPAPPLHVASHSGRPGWLPASAWLLLALGK